MTPAEFRRLVECGAIPPSECIHDGFERWRVSTLEAIGSGAAARPNEDFEL